MFCPDCGGICDSRGLCPACEQRARERAVRNGPVAPFRISAGKRRALDGSLEIGRGYLVLRKKIAGIEEKSIIEYRDIEQVALCKAVGKTRGYIAVRKRGNVLPAARSLWEAEWSYMALTFAPRHNRRFEEVYMFLERQINAYSVLIAKAGYPPRSQWTHCPLCASRDIYNPVLRGSYYYTINSFFSCRVCGYCWHAQMGNEVIRQVIK